MCSSINGDIYFLGESLGHFQIDSKSGELRTTEALLYSWRSTYRMVITAADQGIPSLQGQMDISVEVLAYTSILFGLQ